MRVKERLLVVGTTSDYIDWIRRTCPERALFITAQDVRGRAREASPAAHEELLCDLAAGEAVVGSLAAHLRQWDLAVNGVACFDCESMPLAARLAQIYAVPYPSPEVVGNCRDKLAAKRIWQQHNIRCPQVTPVRQAEDAVAFQAALGQAIVLKPPSGSGSELVFCCRTADECRRAFGVIHSELPRRRENRLFQGLPPGAAPVIAEEFVAAPEFSCDFLLQEQKVRLLRLARKVPAPNSPFGTIMGYELIDRLPGDIDTAEFGRQLARSAAALGIVRGICMVDFMLLPEGLVWLEMTPRPGGDCLPHLIRQALGLDILGLTLDLAQNRPLRLGSLRPLRKLVGLRIHARRGGVFQGIDWSGLAGDPQVVEFAAVRRPGDLIRMPPADYDSFMLGHIIFEPSNGVPLADECARWLERVGVEIANP